VTTPPSIDIDKIRTSDYHENAERTGVTDVHEPCQMCGRPVKYGGAVVRVGRYGRTLVPFDAVIPWAEDLGYFSIGPECLKKLPPEFVQKP